MASPLAPLATSRIRVKYLIGRPDPRPGAVMRVDVRHDGQRPLFQPVISEQRAKVGRGGVTAAAHDFEDPPCERHLPGTEALREPALIQAVEATRGGQGGAASAGQ